MERFSNFTAGYISKGKEISILKRYPHLHVHFRVITNKQGVEKQPVYQSTNIWIRNARKDKQMEINEVQQYLALKSQVNPTIYNSMKESGKHSYTKKNILHHHSHRRLKKASLTETCTRAGGRGTGKMIGTIINLQGKDKISSGDPMYI